MNAIVSKITYWLVDNGTIDEADRELYSYGIDQILTQSISYLSIFIICWLLGGVFEIVLFLISYMPIRVNAGGYHARSKIGCYILSLLVSIIVVVLIKFTGYSIWSILVATSVSSMLVFIIAPKADPNKPFDEIEERVFKSRTRKALILEIVFAIIAILLNQEYIAHIISIAISVEAIALLVKNKEEIVISD